jgi:hypothetical protein
MTTHRFLSPALAILATLAAAAPFAAPVQAQRSERVLTIFGNDPCPSSSSGDEIVVCQRMPESERYRIPEQLRRTEPRNDNWGDRASSLEYVGRNGVQSCSTSGVGGASGCFRELAGKACDEDKADGKKCGIKF